MGTQVYDVIVTGAGLGGVTCAAICSKNGLKTLLVEKNDRPGGKAMTFNNRGFRYELWPITGKPFRNSRFQSVLKELGQDPDVTYYNNYLTYHYSDKKNGPYKRLKMLHFNELPNISRTFEWLGIDSSKSACISRFFSDINRFSNEDISKLDKITFNQFLLDYNLPNPLYSMLSAQLNVVFVLPVDHVPASEGIRVLKEMYSDGMGGYFKGGYGCYAEKCVDAIKKNGGTVIYNTRVKKITVSDDGRVTGIRTQSDLYEAPVVVSNAGIQPTVIKLVGELHFNHEYVNQIKMLVPSMGLMGIRYFLDSRVFDCPFHIAFTDNGFVDEKRYNDMKSGKIPEEMIVFMTVPSEFDSTLSPSGKQCVLTSTLCPPDPMFPEKKAWWKKIDETVTKIWPELQDNVESKELYGTNHISHLTRDHVLPGIGGESIGVGYVVGQNGKNKPSPRSPVQGLFYVGCDAGGYGCGTQQGVDSGYNVAHLVIGEYVRT